jgi:6,7-dimethyl-8-ribityllumazine synthase
MSANIGVHFSNANATESEELIRFFEAIGLEHVAHPGNAGSALFTVPRGILGINMIPAPPAGLGSRIAIDVRNPDVIFDIVQKFNFRVRENSAHSDTPARFFSVELPGGFILDVVGGPAEPPRGIEGRLEGRGKRLAIVVSRFNAFITERLLQGALDGLRRSGVEVRDVVRVPGAFEIPSAARALAATEKYDAIICLGCLLRGDTAHYDVIVNEVTRGIGQSAQETGIPHAFGVLTCDTLEQAIDRAGLKMGNKGFEAALAAVEMANLKTVISHRPPAVRKRVVRRSSVVPTSPKIARRTSSVVREIAISPKSPAIGKNRNKGKRRSKLSSSTRKS